MKLLRVKKADNIFDDYMDGIYMLIYPDKAISLIKNMGDWDIGSAEKRTIDCQKNLPKILAAIKVRKKELGVK